MKESPETCWADWNYQ